MMRRWTFWSRAMECTVFDEMYLEILQPDNFQKGAKVTRPLLSRRSRHNREGKVRASPLILKADASLTEVVMNLPATVSKPQLQNVVGKARIVVCRAAAASWSPSLGKSQPSTPQQKKVEPAEQLKAAEQQNQEAAVPASAEATPAVRRSRHRYRPAALCAITLAR